MFRRAATATAYFICLITIPFYTFAYCAAQCATDSPDIIREQVDGVFNRSLKAMESKIQPGNISVSTWISPADSEQSIIKCLGVAAIPFITAHLNSDVSFGQVLAIRMLGWVGTSGIIPPLTEVLNSQAPQIAKTSALESLYGAPQADALPVLERVSRSDPNPYVRQKAAEVLQRYSSADAP